jgi:hypothetical protein
MSDDLMTNNIFTDIRNDCELWIYTSEMLEEFAEGDENLGDLEYHLAMEIEGTVGNLMVSLIQQAFAEVRALGEDTDDDLFGMKKTLMPRGYNFVIYVNNHPRGKAVSIENAVDRATRYIAGVKDANPEARVHLQVIDDHDGEVMWSGGSGFEGKFYNAGKYQDINQTSF